MHYYSEVITLRDILLPCLYVGDENFPLLARERDRGASARLSGGMPSPKVSISDFIIAFAFYLFYGLFFWFLAIYSSIASYLGKATAVLYLKSRWW